MDSSGGTGSNHNRGFFFLLSTEINFCDFFFVLASSVDNIYESNLFSFQHPHGYVSVSMWFNYY